ncbi:MAG TPA: DUF6455 family protein [Roseovarius sp.]|nr:DUF6455 family protein [Roseovarius sp.]
MSPLGDMRRHYWLVLEMARLAGVDLVAAFRDGQLDNRSWAAMVASCRACGDVDTCEDCLRDHETGSEPPPGCRNRMDFRLLRDQQKVTFS